MASTGAPSSGHPGDASTRAAVETSERRFRKLVAASSDVLLVLDPGGRTVWASAALARVLGHEPTSFVGRPAASVVHPADLGPATAHAFAALGGEPPGQPLVVRALHADGGWRHLAISVADLRDDPDIGGVLVNAWDVTAHVGAEQARARLSLALEASPDLIGLVTRDDDRIRLNLSGCRLLGLPDGSSADLTALAARVPPWVRQRVTTEALPHLEEHGLWEGELAALDTEGDTVPLSVVAVAVHDADGAVETIALVARDISERKAFEEQLEHQATHDPLTSLPNRTLLLDRLGVALGRARRQGSTVAVLFLDLDNFKVVNDSLGHGAGDVLLLQVARRVEEAVRPGDTVARFGGDEFAVLGEDLADPDEALAVALRIEEAVAEPLEIDGTEVVVTASIGVATSDGRDEPETLLRSADAAMYEAKARGRSRTEVFEAAMHVQAVDRLALETALRRALDRRELRLAYQPQLDLATGGLVGIEALLRWEHPERGLLLPGDFLPSAESTGLIVPIGNWVTATACRTLRRLRRAHPERSPVAMSVNLSARQLAAPHLLDDVAAILDELGLPPDALVLEITETDLMDVEASEVALRRMHALGVGVAVDDFGTGWSSLRYLRDLPVDVLKVDRSFVAGLGRSAEDEAIVAAVVDLAHALGLAAIAEGVEEELHLRRLQVLGCDAVQGWLTGRPMDEDALLAFVADLAP